MGYANNVLEQSDVFSIETISRFYKYLYSKLGFASFGTLTPEKCEELDKLVAKWQYYFTSKTTGYRAKLNLVSERLLTSYKNMGLETGDEVAYFFIKLLDPTLLHLEAFESANLADEMKELCFKTFRVFDKNMITLQKLYNARFREYAPEDLWDRQTIKRS